MRAKEDLLLALFAICIVKRQIERKGDLALVGEN